MKNMKVKIIAILLTLVLIGIFLLFFNRKPSIEMTPVVMPAGFTYILPCDDNIEYIEPYGWVQIINSEEYNTDFLIESSSNDQTAVKQIFSFLNLEKRQFCGEITKQNFYEYYYDYYDEDNKTAIHMVFDGFYYVTIYPYGTIITHKVYNDDETNDSNKYYQYLSSGIVYQNIADYLRELYNQNNLSERLLLDQMSITK